MLVLGIDPGTRFVGYGLVQIKKGSCKAVDYGFLPTDNKLNFPQKLKQIYEGVSNLLIQSKPDVVAVEETYATQNAKTTLRLGHARGVILLSIVKGGIPVFEYAPREIKQAVVGRGGASKIQVQWMVAQILHIDPEKLQGDAADGLAVALCHGLRTASMKNDLIH